MAISCYFSEFYTLTTIAGINNRHQIPPSFERKLPSDELSLMQKIDKDFKTSFLLNARHHFQSFGLIKISDNNAIQLLL